MATGYAFDFAEEGKPQNVPIIDQPTRKDPGYMAINPAWLIEQNKLMTHLPWYRNNYKREDAIEELEEQPIGSFLVRYSSQPGHYAISAQMGYALEHMLILPSWDSTRCARGETLYRLGSKSTKLFVSIPDLIQFYTHTPFYTDHQGTRHFFRKWKDNASPAALDAYMELRPTHLKPGYDVAAGSGPTYDTARQNNDSSDLYFSVAEPTYSMASKDGEYDLPKNKHAYFDTSPKVDDIVGVSNPTYSLQNQMKKMQMGNDTYDNATNSADPLALSVSDRRVYKNLFTLSRPQAGVLQPGEAVGFFRASNLTDQTLGTIWTMVNAHKTGNMNSEQFYQALKLLSLAQQDLSLMSPDNLRLPCELPDLGDFSVEAEAMH